MDAIVPAELIDEIANYQPDSGAEREHHKYIVRFLQEHPHPFDRGHLHAHLTGSALILNAEGSHILLGLHPKLAEGLQMGGHGEPGETSPRAVAMREAEEE